jgi:hypothetical protein
LPSGGRKTPDFEWFRDTDPRALKVLLDLHRKMPVSEKLQSTLGMMEMLWNRLIQQMTAGRLRKQ